MVVALILTRGSPTGAVPSRESGHSASYERGYQSGAYGEAHDIRSTVAGDDIACASTMGNPPPENEDDWDEGCLAALRDHPAH